MEGRGRALQPPSCPKGKEEENDLCVYMGAGGWDTSGDQKWWCRARVSHPLLIFPGEIWAPSLSAEDLGTLRPGQGSRRG